MTSPKPTASILAPLPRPADVAAKRDERVRDAAAAVGNRLLYVTSYVAGLVTLQQADGTVIDEAIAWAGVLPPQPGDGVVRLTIPGRGTRDAAPTFVALPIVRTDTPGVVEREGSATNGAAPSTTNISTYATSLTVPIPLGAGLWEIVASGDLLLTHSASGQCDVQMTIDGVSTSRQSPPLSPTVYTRIGSSRRSTGVVVAVGGRTVNVTLDYKPSTAGTAVGRNPVVRVHASRLAP